MNTQEGLSNAVIERMEAGLPSIVTDVEGNPEAVIDGRAGSWCRFMIRSASLPAS